MKKAVVVMMLLILLVMAGAQEEFTDKPREIISDKDVIYGSKIYRDTTDSYMEVWPHTVINPWLQWTYLNITTKKADDFIFTLDYMKELDWIVIQEWKLDSHPYTYCQDEEGRVCWTEYVEYEAWVDVTANYVKQKNNGKDKIDLKKARKLKKDESRLLRIKYKPFEKSGKWNLELEDKTKKKSTLDPWWDATENNITQGFVYMTNISQTDSFRDYPYTMVENAEKIGTFTGQNDAQNLILSSTRKQGDTAFEYLANVTRSTTTTFSMLRQGSVAKWYNFTGTDTFYIAYYINDSSQIEPGNGIRLLLYQDRANSINCQWFTGTSHLNINIIDGWNYLEFPFDDTFACSGALSDWTDSNGTIDQIRIYTYNTNTSNHIIRIDNFFAYNSSHYYDTRWQAESNDWTLQPINNGFGYNKSQLTRIDQTGTYSKVDIDSVDIENDYQNFEIIAKITQSADLGSDVCIMRLKNGTGSNQLYIGYSAGSIRSRDADGNVYTLPGSPPITVYARWLYNGSTAQHYISYDLERPQDNWTLLQNFSRTSGQQPEIPSFRSRSNACSLDFFMIRELLNHPPVFNPPGDYHASFVYQSSEEKPWVRIQRKITKDNLDIAFENDYDPLDSEIPTWSYTMDTFGRWEIRARVYDNLGNNANNWTQENWINITPINQIYLSSGLLLDSSPSLRCYAVLLLPNQSNTNVSVTWYNNSIAFKHTTKICEHNNICTLDTLNQTYIPNIDNVSCQANVSVDNFTFINTSQIKSKTQIGACDASKPYPIINFSYYDEGDDSPINVTSLYSMILYDGTSDANFTETFQDNYSDQICTDINPATTTLNVILYNEISLWKDGYVTRILDIPLARGYSASNDPYVNESLFLVKTNESSSVSFVWTTTDFEPINGVMLISKCNQDGTKNMVASIPIISGEATANLILFTEAYSYEVVIDGTIYSDAEYAQCHVESTNSREFYVDLQTVDLLPVAGLIGINCRVYNTTGSTVTMTWDANAQDGSDLTGCIVAYRTSALGTTEIYRDCLTSPSGSFTRTIPASQYDYLVKGELTQGDYTTYCPYDITFTQGNELKDRIGATGPLMVGLMIIGLGMWFASRGMLLNVMAGIALIAAFILGFLSSSWELIMILLTLIVIVGLVARYTKKREVE